MTWLLTDVQREIDRGDHRFQLLHSYQVVQYVPRKPMAALKLKTKLEMTRHDATQCETTRLCLVLRCFTNDTWRATPVGLNGVEVGCALKYSNSLRMDGNQFQRVACKHSADFRRELAIAAPPPSRCNALLIAARKNILLKSFSLRHAGGPTRQEHENPNARERGRGCPR